MKKNFILSIICFILFFQTSAIGSDNWVNVTNSKGKSIELNMSDIVIYDKYISVYAKAKIKNEDILYNFFVNYDKKTIYLNDIKKIYNKKEERIYIKESERNLPVNPDSLNECIILYLDENTKNDIRRQNWQDWLKYHLDVMKKFNKEWNLKSLKKRYESRIYLTCELKIDKNGYITNYIIDMPESENLKNMINEVKKDPAIIDSVENTIKKIKKFKKLPKSFKGDYIVIKLALIYKYNKSEKKYKISRPDDSGYRNLYIHKIKNKEKKINEFIGPTGFEIEYNIKKIGKFFGDTILFIIFLPIAILLIFMGG